VIHNLHCANQAHSRATDAPRRGRRVGPAARRPGGRELHWQRPIHGGCIRVRGLPGGGRFSPIRAAAAVSRSSRSPLTKRSRAAYQASSPWIPGHVKTRCAARAGTLSRDARRPVTRAPVTRAAAGPGAGLCPAGIQQCRAAPGVWRLGRERRNSARSKYLPSAGWPLRAAPGPAAAGRAAGARLRAAPRRWWAAQGLADRLRPGLDPRYAITTDLDESVIIATIASPDGEPAGPLLIDGYALRSLSS
jgi:hypothetical protein